jgi:type IV pilus assembly protein PilP
MYLVFILLNLLVTTVFAENEKKSRNFFKDKSKLENPFDLRDPFKDPSIKKEAKKEESKNALELNEKGEYSNIQETPLDKLTISEIKVVGVLIGKERRAMVQSGKNGSKVTVLKEGMKIGQDGAELKAILPGGIVLVEKISNVYGEEEFLETVIPISK